MIYGSVTSGIEAATVAWHELGWQPAWFCQHDPAHNYRSGPDFSSRVLQHHYPHVPNLGDMLELKKNTYYNEHAIDLLVGGTPCQDFSVAGFRNGLDGARGNLTLEYARVLSLKRPKWFLWENVPGVFSSGKDAKTGKNIQGKDFAAILSAFTGRDIEPQKFYNSGLIRGTFYSLAWRTMDAQYFGVPQRRRRVFVVGYLGDDWRPPAAVLFEQHSLSRDFTPGEEKRQAAAAAAAGNFNRTIKGEINACTDKGQHKGIVEDHLAGTWWDGSQTAQTLDAVLHKGQTMPEKNRFPARLQGTSAKKFSGPTARSSGLHVRNMKLEDEISGTVQSSIRSLNSTNPVVVYDSTQITSPGNYSNPQPGAPCHPLAKNQHPPLLTIGKKIVRRLTPLEAERLQGFPDNYTKIPIVSKKGEQSFAKDSPRYQALGNSMAIPVMKWLGTRIDAVDKIIKKLQNKT